MSKFYRTAAFRSLNAEWRRRLRQADFKDCEDDKGNLKQHDRRTIAWVNRGRIEEFFRALDQLLQTEKIPDSHKVILTMYSEGVYLKDIAVKVGKSTCRIKQVVSQYKKVLIK